MAYHSAILGLPLCKLVKYLCLYDIHGFNGFEYFLFDATQDINNARYMIIDS